MNIALRNEICLSDFDKDISFDFDNMVTIPYGVMAIYGRFAAMYQKYADKNLVLLNVNTNEIIEVDNYGKYLKDIVLNHNFKSNDYNDGIHEIHKVLKDIVSELVLLETCDAVEGGYEDFEYLEELSEYMVAKNMKALSFNEYLEFKNGLETEQRLDYLMNKED